MVLRDLLVRTGMRASQSMECLSKILRLKRSGARQLELVSMEDRLLFSAAPGPAPEAPADNTQIETVIMASLEAPVEILSNGLDIESDAANAQGLQPLGLEDETSTATHELVFIDTGAANYQDLLDDLWTHHDPNRQIDVVLLTSGEDGIAQITETLAQYRTQKLDAVHLVTHGADRAIKLGNTWLDANALEQNREQIASWGEALKPSADLLVYGCDLAGNDLGRALLSNLVDLTGADIAASIDDTGSSLLGGNWDLEYELGDIETEVAFSGLAQDEYEGLLAAFSVTTTADSGVGSLRQAIIDANALAGADTISFATLGTGTHTISLTSALPAITDSVVIDGWSALSYSSIDAIPDIIINGNSTTGADAFYVSANNVTIRGLNIQRFDAAGIRLDSGTGAVVQGNWIGLNSTGTALAETAGAMADGIQIRSGSNTIGGTTLQTRNVIAGAQDGIRLRDNTATGNIIRGNIIGARPDMTGSFGNTDDGIDIGSGAHSNTIGGSNPGEGNIVVSSGGNGIELRSDAGANNRLSRNSIFASGGLGIENLGTPPSRPALNSASSSGGTTTIGGSLSSAASTTYRIEFYATPSSLLDAAGGEGRLYLGSTNVTTNSSGSATINAVLSVAVNHGDSVTAIAIDPNGNTSEYSANQLLTGSTSELVVDTVRDVADAAGFGSSLTISSLLSSRGSDGTISLREAIDAANRTGGINTIYFNLPGGGQHTINLSSALPTISEGLHINATSDSDYAGTPIVELNGASAGTSTSGLTLSSTASNSSIRGLVINRFGANGILVDGADSVTIAGNYIGTDFTGLIDLGNGQDGIQLQNNAANNTIGGLTSTDRNVVSGNNNAGIAIDGVGSSGNTLIGNYIGLGSDGATSLGNTHDGVHLQAAINTIIGSSNSAGRNVISGNAINGIGMDSAVGTIVQGNYIGTNAAGTAAVGNQAQGIYLGNTSTSNVIGTDLNGTNDATEGNLISGNADNGIQFWGANVSSNAIRGNIIGLNATQSAKLGNGTQGIQFGSGTHSNTIGGTSALAANIVSGNTLAGVELNGSGTSFNTVLGNFIGTNASSATGIGNSVGVLILAGATNNTIGGTTSSARNVISGNVYYGIDITGTGTTNNQIQGNYIGTNVAGTAALANGSIGVIIEAGASSNTIGGSTSARNIISGNSQYGIDVTGATTSSNVITSNYIGLDATGTTAISNGGWGVAVDFNAVGTIIGGTGAGDGNVISGNTNSSPSAGRGGIYVWGTNTRIQGNTIGLNAARTAAVANGDSSQSISAGIWVNGGGTGNQIGGTTASAANVISGNIGAGIATDTSTNTVSIQRNSIYSNSGLGIDLANDGVTLNDSNDADLGSNTLLNFPVIYSATIIGGNVTITGEARFGATVDFYESDDPAGSPGEGRTWIGSGLVSGFTAGTIDSTARQFSFTFAVGSLVSGDRVTATATLSGSTSEFSSNVTARAPGITVTPTSGLTTNESGSTASFTVVLDSAPTANVSIQLGSTDTTEGTISGATLVGNTLTFTTANWSTPQTITVTGVNDSLSDGDITYTISTLSATSSDPNYNGINPSDVSVTNVDNDLYSISGTIYEDVDGDGLVTDDGVGLANAIVSLYRDDGDGVLDAGDSIVSSLVANGSGQYSLTGLSNDTYWVVADSRSFIGTGGLIGGYTIHDQWAEQTYGSTGSVGWNGSAYTFTGTAGAFFGGMRSDRGDNGASLLTAEHVTRVAVASANVASVDYGFSYNVITNTRDGDEVGANNRTIQGSLRQFIQNSNALDTTQSSNFEISGTGPRTILVTSALPTISDSVVLDGTTDASFTSTPVVVINGSGAGFTDGLVVGATSTIRGLVINQFQKNGIWLTTSGNNSIIAGNYIGTDVTGAIDLGNGYSGIELSATGVTIGGLTAADRNVISGNSSSGISFNTSGSSNLVIGNYIGVNATATAALGNSANGIYISAGSNTIGGNTSAEANIIGGNQNGIVLDQSTAIANIIQGNFIGTNAAGTINLGNIQEGIELSGGARDNLIGGTSTGEGNRIRFNGSATWSGISVEETSYGNSFLGNTISNSGALAIQLGWVGGGTPEPNDANDADIGANNLQNYPVLYTAIVSGSQLALTGQLQSAPSTQYRIEFFNNPLGTEDATGHGEARIYLGEVIVTTDASGNATINTTLFGVSIAANDRISATATEILNPAQVGVSDLLAYGSTSEISMNLPASISGAAQVLPGSQTTNEDTTLTFSAANGNAITVDDGTASTTALLQVSLSVPSGSLTFPTTVGLNFVSGANGTGSMVVWGTEAAINTALNGLTFTPPANFNGAANLSVTTSLAESLQGRYEFESAGTPGLDTSAGVLQSGTVLGNAAVVVDGAHGNVLNLDGTGDAIQINSLFDFPTSITIGGWVNLSALSTGRAEFISLNDRVHIALDDAGGVKGSIQTSASTWQDLNSNRFLAGQGWHHVMYVFDDVNNIHTLYIDGSAVVSAVNNNSIYYTGATTTYIGRHPVTTPGWDFEGQIDDVRIISRALSATEVSAIAAGAHKATGTVPITVSSVNDQPAFSNLNGAPTYVENGTAVVLDADVTITDVELSGANNFSGATLTLARNGGANSQDQLAFDGLTVTTSGANVLVSGVQVGTYTFSGGQMIITFDTGATQARVNTLMQKIVYWNSSDAPPASVQINWSFSDGNAGAQGSGGALQATGSTTVNITRVNDSPTVTTTGSALAYMENQAATTVDSDLAVSDADNISLTGATVTISGNYANGQDVLAFTNQLGITGSWNAATGVLTLAGTTTVSNYQTALRSVTYVNTSDNPSTLARTVSFIVYDGTSNSTAAARSVTVTAVDDNPVVTTTGTSLVYTENQAAMAVDNVLNVSDVDNTNLAGATVTISGNYANGQDVLAFTNQLGITGSWNAATGVLTLTGTATVANYQTALQSVTYNNTSDQPSTLVRTISFVVNDGTASSTAAIRDITVSSINDQPVFSSLNGTPTFIENGTAVVLDSSVSVSDAELDALNGGLGNYDGASLTIIRNGGANSEDVLWVNAGSGLTLYGSEIRKNGETIAWLNRTSTPGRLIVDFTDNNNEIPTTADVNSVLRQISYSNSSDAPPTSVQLDWTLDDGGMSGSGGVQSVTGSVAVSITPTNDAPRLDLDGNDSSRAIQGGYHAQFNVGSAPVTVADVDTTIVDLDSPSIISGEIVSFTGFVDAGQEILTVGGEQFTIGTAKSASVVVGGSTFSLVSDGTDLQFTVTSGTGAAADWQALLSGMTYEHTGTPTVGVRSFIVLVRDSSNARSNVAEAMISVSNNEVPTFSGTLGGTINITEGDAPTVLDGNVTVTDAELSLADNFAGATLTLQRSSGASWTDQFGATGTLSFSGDNVIIGGTTIGTYVNSSGTLAITFSANATNALVNQTLQQITYSNTSNTPPATLDVEWTFFDGVDARAFGITTVNVTPVNDAPSLDLDSNNSSGATGSDYRGQYNLGGGAVRVADTDTYLSDSDSSTFTSGTLSGFTGFLNAGQEVLTIGGQQFTIGVTNSASVVVGSDTFGIVYNGTDFQITVTAGSGSSSNWNSLISGMTYRHTGTPTDGDRSFSIAVRDSTGTASNVAISTITVSSNEAPTFSGTLAGAVTFSENGAAVVLDSDVAITDPELTSLNNFNGAKLTIARSGGSNASDVFSATGTLNLTGGNVVVGGTTIGTYTNGSGALTMTFNGSATNALVNSAMRQIAYSNTSVYPPTSVVLSWTFNDGNTGSQGAGGSLSVTDTKTVTITATTNDPPVSTNSSITINENVSRTLSTNNFGSYQDETSLQGVRITTPPLAGALELYDGSAWTAVTLNQTVIRADIDAGHLRFVPSAGQAGSPYATIGFEVFDGVSYSLASYTLTVNVTPNADNVLTGNYLQIGLNGRGTLVTDNNVPTGYVTAGSPLGAVSDPDRDGWAAYSGDFIYPGSPVEYWGLSIGGSSYTNDSHGSGNVSGSYSNFQSGTAGQSIEWLGSQSGLDVRQVYSVGVNDLFLDFQVELTNHSGAALNDVYYFRDTDPDNNVDQGSPDGYYTTNTIVSQGNQSGLSMVTATQVDGAYFAILAYGDNSRVTYGGFGNTSATDIYNGQNGLSQTGSTYDDISVSVAYYFASIADGDTVTMHVRYYFGQDDGGRPVIDLDADNSSGSLGSDFSTTFIENGGPVRVADTDATILNPEGPALDQVTVTITNLLDGAAEQLLADTSGTKINASYNSSTGVLTLSGLDSVVNYNTVLKSLQYDNSSSTPNTTARQITVTASFDGLTSGAATTSVSIIATNNAPSVTTTGTALALTENQAATAVDSGLAVSDGDNTNLTGATVTISGNYANGQDILAFTNQLGITGSWNASTGVLTLTGTTTVANYQTAMRSITYVNTSDNPSTLVRTVSFEVNDGSASSAAATRSITVTAVNDAPVMNASSPLGAINEDDINNTGTLVSLLVDTEVSDADGGTALKGIAVIGVDTSNGSWEYSLDGTNWLTMGTPTLSSARLLAADATTRVRFIPSANFNGASGLLTYKAWDQTQGAVGSTFNIVSTGGSTAFSTGTNGTSVSVGAVNDAPVISTNSLTISEGATVVLGAGDISASDVEHSSTQLTYTVSGVSGGQFEYAAAPGSVITSFTQDDINTGKVQFVHSGGESAPAYNLTVSDGALAEGPSTASVNFTSINDAPVVTTSGSALAYTENQAAVAVDSALTVSDIDSANLTGATITISGNYANGQDVLSFTNQLGISGSWNATTGVLTLTGSTTVANYQTALRSVTYVNTSDNPSTLARTVSFAVNDGTANSTASTRNITVTAVNDDPQISLASVGGPFVEGGPAVLFDTAPFVSDPDSANFDTGTLTASIASAGTIDDRVTIRNQGTAAGQIGVSGSDVTYGGIVIGTWTGGTDGFTPLVVTLNSQATVAAVQALSGNIQFSNVSENPSTTSRLVRIVLTDGDGGTSNNGQNLLAVTAVNDAPVVTTTGTSLTYTENQSATAVDSALTISDIDNTNLTGAIVSISGNYANGQDLLAFTNQLGITGSWNAAAGVLTLTGTTTVANYQTALRSITYVNSSDAPSTLARTVSFLVNDGAANSTAATRGISITSVNDAPTIGSGSLAAVLEDTLNPAGATISSLVGSSFADPDAGASLSGIVVTSNNAPLSEGVWQYSTDSGTSWFDVGTVGVTGLALNVSTRVRFVPAADFSGSPTIISFRGLDNTYAGGFTSGATRVTVDTSSPGGTSAISSSLVSINTTVTAVNDVPVRTAGSVNNLTVLEDSGLTSLGLSGVTYSPGGGVDENSQTLTYTVTAIPALSVGRVYLADGTTAVTVGSYTLTEIRGMQFQPTDNASGVSAFQFNVTDSGDTSNGGQNSFSEFILLTVSAVNDAPVLATSTGTLAYSENDLPTPVDPSLTVSDVDNVNLTGATITISSNFVFGEDVLAFTNQFGITGSWNAATGVLTLTGTTSVTNYQAALRTVTYANTSGTPSTLLRTIQFQVSDGATSSSPAFREVSVAAVNNAPTISSISDQTIDEDTVLGPLAFTVNDIDSSNLVVTTATSDGSLIPLGNIVLGGTGTNRTVTVTPAPNLYGGPVTITLTVSDGGLIAQTSFDVIVQPINDPPTISNSTFSVSEIASNGTLVGTVVAGDVDLGDTRSFSVLSGDPLGAFTIDATGQITVADASQLDFETRPTWTLTVQVRDGAGATATSTVTVNLIDANDNNPVIVSNSGGNTASISLAENTTSVTTVMATDADAGTTLQYSLSGADAGRFQIDINTGALSFLAAPDFESPADANGDNAYEVTVIASDGVRTDSQALTVSVSDVNEFAATAVVDNDAAANTVAENATVGTAVGITVFADDHDGTDTVSYSLLNDAGGRFSIDVSTGIVRVASTLDYETSTSHTIRVQALSTDGSTSFRDFTITVADVNEFGTTPISDTNPATETVPENLAVGSPVGFTAFADDLDGTDTVSYSLLNSAGGRFAINVSTGVVTLNAALDYETSASHTIRVQALSTDGSSTFRDFTFAITDVNEFATTTVVDNDGAANTVAENAIVGTVVGITAFADDFDGTDIVNYSLLSDAGGRFAIDPVTGIVTVAGAIDYETGTSHTIRVLALSTDGSSTFRGFSITVTDVNEFGTTPISDTNPATETVPENLAVGSPVGVTAFADDLDGTDTVSYSLLNSAGGRFSIDTNTGVVTLASALDYETNTSHTIRVQALSTDGSSTFHDFTFVITDVNEFATTAVVDNEPAADTVAENATIGTAVGVAAFADDLDGTDTVSYSLRNDAGGLFAIDASTGIVTVASGLDYETSTSHTIRVQALSTDGSSTFRDFTISVTEINEFDMTSITDVNGAVNVVAENSAIGTVVGVTAFADDLDRSDTVTYSLDSNAGGLVAIDPVTGVVTVNGAIDFEVTSQLSFIVRATSTDSSTSTQSFTVDVLDRNDTAPIVSGGQTFTVAENALNGTSVGTVLASDVDTVGGLQNWQIVGGTGAGAFSINAVTGEITVADSSRLNFEATPALTLQVTVSDGIQNSAVQTVTILLSDVNERPTLVGGSLTLAENAASGTVIGSLSASDVDAGDSLSYSIVGGNAGGAFSIDATTGEITVVDSTALDFETTISFTLTAQVTDRGGLTHQQAVTISLLDLNERPTLIDGTYRVPEWSALGTSVGIVSASDVDMGDSLTFRILSGNTGGRFLIDSSTGEIRVANPVDFTHESQSSFSLTVEVEDQGGLTHSALMTVIVDNVNVPPTALDDFYSLVQFEPLVTTILNGVLLNDSDSDSPSLTLTLISGPANGMLTLNPDGSFTYTSNDLFAGVDTFTYQLSDGFETSRVATVSLTVGLVGPGGGGNTNGNGGNSSGGDNNSDGSTDETDTDNATVDVSGGGSSTATTTAPPLKVATPPRVSIDTGTQTRMETPTNQFVVSPLDPTLGMTTSSTIRSIVRAIERPIASAIIPDLTVVRELVPEPVHDLTLSILQNHAMWNQLNSFRDDLDSRRESTTMMENIVVGTTTAVSGGLTVGYVIWLIRGGSLLATMMSVMPTWISFDPLPVMDQFEEDDLIEDEESLASIVTGGR